MSTSTTQRLSYLDWLRGLACLLMFQTHCYDSWLAPSLRKSHFFGWSQFIGSLPAPMFLFFAGISSALVTDKMRRKGIGADEIARKSILRGAEIFVLALLFRLQEFLLGYFNAPWTDLFRVDILNVIGISLMLMGLLSWLARERTANAAVAAAVALAIAALTPPLWTTWRPTWLPWYLESYIDGVHIYKVPQHGFFPIFPWAAFAFAGLAVGFVLVSDWSRENASKTLALLPVAGIGLFFIAKFLDSLPHFYTVYDYWHTSPNFFLARVGVLFVITYAGYAWCRWGAGEVGFSPLIQIGQTSLLVYWVHIEFVYGGLSILARQSQTIASASFGLLLIFASMVLLSMARTRLKGRGSEILGWFHRSFRRPFDRELPPATEA